MKKRTITKEMQAVLESPEFKRTQAELAEVIAKYLQWTKQLQEPFERLHAQMQKFRDTVLGPGSPIAELSEKFREAYIRCEEFLKAYEGAEKELMKIEERITPVINSNMESSQMVGPLTTQIKCLKSIVEEVDEGEAIARDLLCALDELDEPEMKAELNERLANINSIRERALALIKDKTSILEFLNKHRIKDETVSFDYDQLYVAKIYDVCEDNALRGISPWEFQQCVGCADYELIKERVMSNQALYYLLYLIGKIKNKVTAKERKQWCIQATESIGYSPTDTTKWRGNLSERWLEQVDRIK